MYLPLWRKKRTATKKKKKKKKKKAEKEEEQKEYATRRIKFLQAAVTRSDGRASNDPGPTLARRQGVACCLAGERTKTGVAG